jgi:para-nitrobenzyl esterase
MKTVVAMFIASAAIAVSPIAAAQTVTVTGGKIQGAILDKGGAVFKGIPYAQPPVGELRWHEPVPVKPWAGVRDATAFGAICAQNPPVVDPKRFAGQTGKEDCLFLNVWTAEWPSKSRKPVMVWIPGGANRFGSTSDARFDGESLAQRGVVLVSLNYRLGLFGFFSHPELTRESSHHASGNQGILDQIAALKWVRDNIAKFGGDPSNVTIFGESAGSLDVSVLMTSPLSKGLFRRAIGESGAVILSAPLGDPLTLSQAEKLGETVAATWSIPASASVRDLRAVSTADILKAESGNPLDVFSPNMGIIVDAYDFPKKPAEVFATGEEHRVALLLGNNARERFTPPPMDLKKAINETYGPIAGRAQALYVGAADPIYGTPADQWKTDNELRCSAVAQLAWHAAAGNPAFEFEFARVPPGREAVGATHASELGYVFGTLDRAFPIGPPAQPNALDGQLSEAMQRYWTNFAKTGNPNGEQLPTWPGFDVASRAYVQFTDAGPVANEGLRRPYCDLFIENVRRVMAK